MVDKILSHETYSMLGQWAIGFCKDLVVAVIVFIIGNWLIKWTKKLVKKMLLRSKIEPSLTTFLTSIVNVVLWLTLIIIVISILGIETSSFIALFAFGLMQCELYRRTEALWCPMLQHMLFNATNIVLLFMFPSMAGV